MTEFVNMWKNYVNFSDRTTRRGYWMAFLFYIIIYIVLYGLLLGGVAVWPFSIFALASFLPYLAMAVRRLRDAGRAWTWIFISFVPIVGGIWYIIILCKPSVPDDGIPVV